MRNLLLPQKFFLSLDKVDFLKGLSSNFNSLVQVLLYGKTWNKHVFSSLILLLHIRTLSGGFFVSPRIHWLLCGCFLHLAKKAASKLRSELKVVSQMVKNWNSIKHTPWFEQFRDLPFNHFAVTIYNHLLYWSMSRKETESPLLILTEII